MFVRRTLAALAIGAVLAGVTATAASGAVPEGMTNAAYRALHVRSEALMNNGYANTAYGNAGAVNGPGNTPEASTPVASTNASTSFAWGDFGIGMAAGLGLVLLAGGVVVLLRTGTRKQVGIPS